ncbi:MAG TPA: carboxypeptidase-like regulatory domain-containing protein [Bacteroidia bacterium]|nr:carboxypeptidase-like regulatory domain-containing protein [Bacteroidia bacterium]
MKKQKFRKDDSPETFIQAIDQLDEMRVDAMVELKDILEIQNEITKIEQARLAKKYDGNHHKVKSMNDRLEYNKLMFQGFDEAIKRSKVKQNPFKPGSWAVEGRVYDKNSNPAVGLTVFLSDSESNWLTDTDSACTDETGYYTISIDEKFHKALAKLPILINVSKAGENILCTDDEPLFVKKGIINNRDLYLSGKECPPPERKNDTKNNS